MDNTAIDQLFIRLLRKHLGQLWQVAKPEIIAALPAGVDASLLDKYVDDSPSPSISVNAYGVEPRFYAHRISGRLLEFYRSK